MKTFNTTAVCIPAKHYMVDLGSRLVQIKKMVMTGNILCSTMPVSMVKLRHWLR